MNDTFFELLKTPVLWQRNTEAFWDDEHISMGMLDAHLNPDRDAASRKHRFIERSVEWLSDVIPANSKILDLGCGPGLYTKQLSDLGYDVTGIDFSKRSISYAKHQDPKTKYIYKNYLELDYSDTFNAVILIYGDYAALTPEEQKTLLEKVYKALKPGGLFILDVFTNKQFAGKKKSTSWSLCENGCFWSAEPNICLESNYFYENNTVECRKCVVVTKCSIKEYLLWDSAYTVQKLTDEVIPFGFAVKSVFDDVCGSPYTGEADTLCFILEKGGE